MIEKGRLVNPSKTIECIPPAREDGRHIETEHERQGNEVDVGVAVHAHVLK